MRRRGDRTHRLRGTPIGLAQVVDREESVDSYRSITHQKRVNAVLAFLKSVAKAAAIFHVASSAVTSFLSRYGLADHQRARGRAPVDRHATCDSRAEDS